MARPFIRLLQRHRKQGSGSRNLLQVGIDGQGAIAGVASLPNWRAGEESWCIVKPFSLFIAACRLWSPAPLLFGAGEAAGFAVRGFLLKLHYMRHSKGTPVRGVPLSMKPASYHWQKGRLGKYWGNRTNKRVTRKSTNAHNPLFLLVHPEGLEPPTP